MSPFSETHFTTPTTIGISEGAEQILIAPITSAMSEIISVELVPDRFTERLFQISLDQFRRDSQGRDTVTDIICVKVAFNWEMIFSHDHIGLKVRPQYNSEDFFLRLTLHIPDEISPFLWNANIIAVATS